ncbi:unnamed protein product [Durusdinium trenchii]|uniref:Uncharacterized protein n=1 Tax=Durusdinium trenchii TaxID=1381693 RepID=A0ABP0MRA7_9DINO
MLVQFAWLCSSPHDGCEPEGDKSARQEDQLKSKVQKMLREKHRRLVSFESDFLAAIDVRTDSSVVGFFSVNEGGKREQDGRRHKKDKTTKKEKSEGSEEKPPSQSGAAERFHQEMTARERAQNLVAMSGFPMPFLP